MSMPSPSLFDTLEVRPILGRLPTLEDEDRVAVISHALWLTWFGGDPAVIGFLKGRALANLGIVNKRLEKSPYLIADKPTIADISMTGYLYYPAEEFGFDIAKDFPAIGAWLERIKALPGAHDIDGNPF